MNVVVDQARANVREKYKMKHRNLPVFVYNDAFDQEHHPVKDFMISRLIKVHNFLNLPDGGVWVYFVTIHGVLFKYMTAELSPRCLTQLGIEELKFFSELPNLRYINVNDDSFEFALTHYENEVAK